MKSKLSPIFVVETDHSVPIVELVIAFRVGSTLDPEGREGALSLALSSLRRGAGKLSCEAIDTELDRLGAEFSTSTDAFNSSIQATVIARNLSAFFALLATLLREPTFADDEVSKLVRQLVAGRIDSRNDDRTLCARHFRRHLFAGHPLGRPAGGTLDSLPLLNSNDARSLWRQLLHYGPPIVGAAGAIDQAQLSALWQQHFSDLCLAPPKRTDAIAEPSVIPGRHLVIIDKPARTQTQIMIGTLGTHYTDGDHHALIVANTAFGGTFTSRLTTEVRGKRGWSYGASARLDRSMVRDAWTMWTFPAAADAAACVSLQLKLLSQWRSFGLKVREAAFAKKYLVESQVFEEDTASKRASLKLEEALGECPPGYHQEFEGEIKAVTITRANAAIKKRIHEKNLLICVTATAEQLRGPLEKAIGKLDSVRVVSFENDEFFAAKRA
jgi:zinc protease